MLSSLSKQISVAFICCLSVSAAFCAFSTTNIKSQQAQPSYLFVLSAEKGRITATADQYYLLLKQVDPHTLWFTDRPMRKAGFLETKKFIANWSNAFGGDSPNAGLVHAEISVDSNGQHVPLAIELISPVLDSVNGDIRFQILLLNTSADNQSKNSIALKAQSFSQVHLFIDPPAARLMDFHEAPI